MMNRDTMIFSLGSKFFQIGDISFSFLSKKNSTEKLLLTQIAKIRKISKTMSIFKKILPRKKDYKILLKV